MEGRYNLRPRVSGRVQASNNSHHVRSQRSVPAAGVPPSSDVHSLRQALLSAEEDNLKLSYENAALQEEKRKLQEDNSSLQRTLERELDMAKQDVQRLKTALEASQNVQDECKKREELIQEKDRDISSLQQSLQAQKEETENVRDFWTQNYNDMKAAYEKQLKTVKSMYEIQHSSDLQQMQGDCQRKVSQLQEQITEQDKVISSLRDEIKARTEEHFIVSSQLSRKQTELDQSMNKCKALEEVFKRELAEREESWEKKQKEMEKLWREREDALKEKASQAEQELQQIIIKNIHLQEVALKKKNKGKKRGFWGSKREKRCSEQDEAALCSVQQERKRLNFWGKRKPRSSTAEEEATVPSAPSGQEEERKEKKRGFWSWAGNKKSSHSDSSVGEGAACPTQSRQQ